eukprot:629618-Prymnesium_polylepis.2
MTLLSTPFFRVARVQTLRRYSSRLIARLMTSEWSHARGHTRKARPPVARSTPVRRARRPGCGAPACGHTRKAHLAVKHATPTARTSTRTTRKAHPSVVRTDFERCTPHAAARDDPPAPTHLSCMCAWRVAHGSCELDGAKREPPSLWMRNVQLAIFSIPQARLPAAHHSPHVVTSNRAP